MDLVSVIIPTHRRPELCLRAVKSVFAQTHKSIEVIVVNDGADSATTELLRGEADPRLQVIELSPAHGQNAARNAGVNRATGKWVAFLDDDDEWYPNKVEQQLAILENDPDAENTIVSCRLVVQTNRRWLVLPQKLYDGTEPVSEYLFCRTSSHDHRLTQSSTLFLSRELCLKAPYDSNLKKHTDYDFVMRANTYHGTKVRMCREPLVIWHQDDNTVHQGAIRKWRYSLEWMNTNANFFTPKSRLAFYLLAIVPPPSQVFSIISFVWKHREVARAHPLWIMLMLREWAMFGRARLVSLAHRLKASFRRLLGKK